MHCASGWQVPLIGGNANNGSNARLCYLNTNNDSSNANSNIEGRHCKAAAKQKSVLGASHPHHWVKQ